MQRIGRESATFALVAGAGLAAVLWPKLRAQQAPPPRRLKRNKTVSFSNLLVTVIPEEQQNTAAASSSAAAPPAEPATPTAVTSNAERKVDATTTADATSDAGEFGHLEIMDKPSAGKEKAKHKRDKNKSKPTWLPEQLRIDHAPELICQFFIPNKRRQCRNR